MEIEDADIKIELQDPEENSCPTVILNAEVLSEIKLESDPGLEQNEEEDEGVDPLEVHHDDKNKHTNFESLCGGLTVQEMVRLHFDPFISKHDFSRQPVMKLEKVDKYWPVPKSSHNIADLKIKEESQEDWELAAEEEIIKANKSWSKINYRVVEQYQPDESIGVQPEPSPSKTASMQKPPTSSHKSSLGSPATSPQPECSTASNRPGSTSAPGSSTRTGSSRGGAPSRNSTPDSLEDMDDPDSASDDLSSPIDEDDDDDDDDYLPNGNSRLSPELEDINENLRLNSLDDNSNDQVEVKLEEIEYEDIKIVDIGGIKIETFGDYSKCPTCEKHIKSTFIIRHIKLHDVPVRILKCPHQPCKTSFTRTNNMYRHMKIVHGDPEPYLCVYKNCELKFKESKKLRAHVGEVHKTETRKELEEIETSETKYKCEFPDCNREYGKRQHLKEHFRKHTGDMRYSCEVCGERFFVHGHMKRHLYSHTGIKPHACRWKCGAIFASYGGRMKHERAQHSENPYKLECDICGRPFRFDRELDKHKLTHLAPDERQAYRCSYCGIIFDSVSHRERHEQRHKDNDTFECEECHKFFKNEKNLRHHSKTHHETQQTKKTDPNKKERKKPPTYECHMCDIPIKFALTALRRHLARKHSTNFKCEKEGCNKTFAKQYQFDAHMKLHNHRHCHLCGKDFKRKQNADIHLMGVHGLTKEDLEALGR